MKQLCLIFLLLFSFTNFAQKPCEYTTNIVDSIGSYKATKGYLMHEKNFTTSSFYIFFSLVNDNGTPLLNLQTITKSADFIKANCLNANSKIIFQLLNGKIITLLHTQNENCGTMLRVEEENKYSRFNSGSFLFLKGSFEDLKASPITLMRIQYSTETLDYVIKKEFRSELTNETYFPENYFIHYLNCLE